MFRAAPPLVALALLALGCDPIPSVEGAEAAKRPLEAKQAPRRVSPPLRLEPVVVAPARHPLASIGQRELLAAVRRAPASLGSMSIGAANRGALFNAVQMPEGDAWELNEPDRSWGTQETVDALASAITSVAQQFPHSPKLVIGDMSKRRGGYFRPHRSHQSGRDADIGYYYLGGKSWYRRADAENLDRPRTWSLLKALLTQGSVEYLFLDRSVQLLLKEYALATEYDKGWVEQLFDHPGDKTEGIIRHVRGHDTHMHVRFFSDQACETSRRAYPLLARYGKI